MSAGFRSTFAYKHWRLSGPAFLAPRAVLETWNTLGLAILFKLNDRWARTQVPFRERVSDPIGFLLGDLEIRLPGIRAVVRSRPASDADYGKWEVEIRNSTSVRTVDLPVLEPILALVDPELALQLFALRLAIELHSALEGARSRPYRPVPGRAGNHVLEVREACALYEGQFGRPPYRVTLSIVSWFILGYPTAIDWVDSSGTEHSTPVILLPDEDDAHTQLASREYLKAMHSPQAMTLATGYTPERHAARRSLRPPESEKLSEFQLVLRRDAARFGRLWQGLDSFREWWRVFRTRAGSRLASVNRDKRARRVLDIYEFVQLYRDVCETFLASARGLKLATEIISLLPLASLPTRVSAKLSSASGNYIDFTFFARDRAVERTLTLKASDPDLLIHQLLEETHRVIQEQGGLQSVERRLPCADDPATLIREMALEYEIRYQLAAFGLIISVPAWEWFCAHQIHGERIRFSVERSIRSLPIYLTGDWPSGRVFQVASEKRIALRISKGQVVPLSLVPHSVRLSFAEHASTD